VFVPRGGDRSRTRRGVTPTVKGLKTMTEDRMMMLFFEMFSGLPRQGPGDSASTLRALALVPGAGPESCVLDVGCGTGSQTLVLAQHSPARFVAIDLHAPFVNVLNEQARAMGMEDRIEARVGDMRQLDFAPGSFDLVWSEGAISIMGFEAGLREWRRLLVPGGYMAVTEVCWIKRDPPPDCAAFWAQEYPAIRDVSVLLEVIAECGYETVGHFALPAASWWHDYYRPLQQNVIAFRERHSNEPDARELADQVQREIDVWHAYSEFYSYRFFVMRAR
jgi:cyclopropane fatty-acyl-phospholipid synthase-like methyltransferase